MNELTPLAPVTNPALGPARRLRHGFFTRVGGISQGIYAGLNTGLGSADNADAVRENRHRIAHAMGVDAGALNTCHQVHSPDVVTVTAPIPADSRPKADAMVTDRPGMALCVLTADCAPVLFADAEARIVGAAHAGWKGALTGVLENTVSAMEALGADRARIGAVVGPCIAQPSYEVGPEFGERFVAADPANAQWFTASDTAGHFCFDLPGYCVARLANIGVDARWTGHDTYRDDARFFSYRRATHRGEPDYGRQMSLVVIA